MKTNNFKVVGHMSKEDVANIMAYQAKRFKVIENRGCGIMYDYMLNLTEEEAYMVAENMNCEAIHNIYLQNGNNDPYSYCIEEY